MLDWGVFLLLPACCAFPIAITKPIGLLLSGKPPVPVPRAVRAACNHEVSFMKWFWSFKAEQRYN